VDGVEAWPYKAAGAALEVIPRTLAQNCGANVIRTLTKLRAKHAEAAAAGGASCSYGINGETGGWRLGGGVGGAGAAPVTQGAWGLGRGRRPAPLPGAGRPWLSARGSHPRPSNPPPPTPNPPKARSPT
jgi:hypothetical protein